MRSLLILCSLSYPLCSLSEYYLKLFAERFNLQKPLNNRIMKRIIILLLVLSCFRFSYAEELTVEQQQLAWKFIQENLVDENIHPIIFRSDIVIKLDGNVSHADSVCMNELIRDLKIIIPTRKIYLAKENANMTFHYNETTFPPDFSEERRRKFWYYQLYRSLVSFSPSKQGTVGLGGCVFDESNYENITYNPYDAFILNRLYADDFKEQFKMYLVSNDGYRQYLVHKYHNGLDLLSFLLACIIPAIFLTRLIIKGTFKPHNWSWKEYNKQGLYLMVNCCICLLFISLADLRLDFRFLTSFIFVLVFLIAINLSFYIERFILKNRNLGGSKVIVIFFVTFIVISISFLLLIPNINNERTYPVESVYPISTFSYIILFPLARSLYIFLNDRYKSIINQKDVELAQMGELQKQAELQSLRAKINPHFLYNALNSIASLATTDARKTEQMALALSDFFKYAINREQKQLNTLSEELNAIRTYLEIEKVRFGDRLSFEIDCPEELLTIQIPQLLIQPLVENAIKHGLSQITENGLIRILVSRVESQLKIRVYDNGPAFPDGPLCGFGIQNTQERIVLLYGTKATINWQNGVEKYIEISIPL